MVWGAPKEQIVDGTTVQVSEDVKHRNRHGAMKYMVEVMDGRDVVHTEYCDQSRWLGHCFGQLFLPIVVKNAKKKSTLITGVQDATR